MLRNRRILADCNKFLAGDDKVRDSKALTEPEREHLYTLMSEGRLADEEDVALSAFDSFCRGAEQGRFPRLDDRDDLWQPDYLPRCRWPRDRDGNPQRKRTDDLPQQSGQHRRDVVAMRGASMASSR